MVNMSRGSPQIKSNHDYKQQNMYVSVIDGLDYKCSFFLFTCSKWSNYVPNTVKAAALTVLGT